MHKGNPTSVACIFLLFLILNPVSPGCDTGTAAECRRARIVPGHDLIGRGIDITTMIKARMIVDVQASKNSDGTCNLCRNKFMNEDPQRTPLDVINWRNEDSCKSYVTTKVAHGISSVASFQEEMVTNEWKTSLNIPVKKVGTVQTIFAGSHSKMVTFFHQSSSNERRIFVLREMSCIFYSFGLRPDPQIDSNFLIEVNKLPAEYNSITKAAYVRLIQLYGTHVTIDVGVGGHMRYIMSLYECQVSMVDLSLDTLKDCLTLQMGISFGIRNVSVGGESSEEICNKDHVEEEFKKKFRTLIMKETNEFWGGNLPQMTGTPKKIFDVWRTTIHTHPGIVKSVLDPIHAMLGRDNPRKEALKAAVRDYIEERSLEISCPSSCPTWGKPNENCSCICDKNDMTNQMCCTKHPELGVLTVWIDKAENLWGDLINRADTYVVATIQGKESKTGTISHTNNPVFDTELKLGVIQLTQKLAILTIEVKEVDPTRTESLGECSDIVGAGLVQHKVCSLNHGTLNYRYEVVCGPNLKGSECEKYVPGYPTFKSVLKNI